MILNQFSEIQPLKKFNSTKYKPIKPFTCIQQNTFDFYRQRHYQKSSQKFKSIKLSSKTNKEDEFQKLLQKIQKVKQDYQNDQINTLKFNQSLQKQNLYFERVKSKPQSPQIYKSPRKMKTLKGTESIFGIDKQNYLKNRAVSITNLNLNKNLSFDQIYDSNKQNFFEKKVFSTKTDPISLFSTIDENLRKLQFNFNKLKKNSNEIDKLEVKKKIFIDKKILQKLPVRQSINFDEEIFSGIQNNLNFAGQIKKQNLKFSDFEIGSCIGSGKFGEVYICRHKKTNFICALKKILKSTIEQYKMVDQFVRQLKISYMVNHPNVVKTYGHFHDEFHVFILMEYATDGNAIKFLDQKKGEQFSSKVLFQTLNAVDHLHGLKIVHRDIKPENIVVFFKDTFKLCDFGLSTVVQNDMKHTFCGTLDYVSPQMKDIGKYDLSVDLWSLGVLTFQLIVGQAPFKDKILQWKKSGWKKSIYGAWKVMYPKGISQSARSFMQSLLRENPHERRNLSQCLRHEFIKANNKKEINIIKAAQVSGF